MFVYLCFYMQGPGVIGAAWSVFYFREIRGWKNYAVLLVACSVTAASAILTAFSKTTTWSFVMLKSQQKKKIVQKQLIWITDVQTD